MTVPWLGIESAVFELQAQLFNHYTTLSHMFVYIAWMVGHRHSACDHSNFKYDHSNREVMQYYSVCILCMHLAFWVWICAFDIQLFHNINLFLKKDVNIDKFNDKCWLFLISSDQFVMFFWQSNLNTFSKQSLSFKFLTCFDLCGRVLV